MQERAHLGTLVDTMAGWGTGPAVVEHRGVRRFRTGYAELAAWARRFAAELERRGIGSGDRVLLRGANSAEWVAAFFGCVLRGVLVVPLDAGGSRAFAEKVARETAPRLLVGDRALLNDLPGLPLFRLDELARLPDRLASPVALGLDTPLQILFTSGTTGSPRGVVHTHRNLLASVRPMEREIAKYRRYERWVHPLRIAHTLPLSHVFGQFMGLWVAPVWGLRFTLRAGPASSWTSSRVSEFTCLRRFRAPWASCGRGCWPSFRGLKKRKPTRSRSRGAGGGSARCTGGWAGDSGRRCAGARPCLIPWSASGPAWAARSFRVTG